ncbi:hypothetical protein Dda_1247 [Drechslerella dactyloides]|uniref:Uncharacterized protein n=1 Tax=Drechslerella dactyloides TaxID=74499 RepID=A0AAD6NKE4_DREDA|nr:hypothetical protein Dda_1247 [Drechslerella dactyloides]
MLRRLLSVDTATTLTPSQVTIAIIIHSLSPASVRQQCQLSASQPQPRSPTSLLNPPQALSLESHSIMSSYGYPPRKGVSMPTNINKMLPPLPVEPRTPQTVRRFGRSVSHVVLHNCHATPATAPAVRQRDVSFDVSMLRRPVFERDENNDRDDICKISTFISSPGSSVPDDADLFENSAWWAGRYMAISDRLRGEMPYSTQDERDQQAAREMKAQCLGDLYKERILQIWWINFRLKEPDEQEQGKKKTQV